MARTKPLEEDEPRKFARGVLDHIIAKHDPEVAREQGKNPAAVALGRRGGAKGGQARAKNPSAKKRKAIAKKAAKARWEEIGERKLNPFLVSPDVQSQDQLGSSLAAEEQVWLRAFEARR